MRTIDIAVIATAISISTSSFGDSACEKKAKTRDDFLSCSRVETDRMLADSGKLYNEIRKLTNGESQIELDENFKIWKEKIKSDCSVIGHSFNEWGNDYAPDTDFQISACREKIAAQELEFYKWLACPDDMETSNAPKCAAIKNALGVHR